MSMHRFHTVCWCVLSPESVGNLIWLGQTPSANLCGVCIHTSKVNTLYFMYT